MPDEFKNLLRGTDAADMSDTATPGSLDPFLLDGDAPRLGGAPVLPPAGTVLPAAAPVAAAPPLEMPSLPTPSLPTPSLPDPALAELPVMHEDTAATETAEPAEPRHPMAHLMPAKSQPSQSSVWAAELRAQKKAKARRTKIIASIVFVVVCAVVGPPLGTWLVNAINETGTTKTDEPATTTTPAAPATTAPAAVAATTPVGTAAPATAGGILGLPDQAQSAVDGVNGATAPAPTAAP